MFRVSIIMPVYNVELFLERAVNSVLMQTFKDFELIMVDDGSTDKSGEICDKLASSDKRVRVIHQDNKGASEAREKGFNSASYENISFVDSDDFILPNMYESLMSAAKESDADIVRGGMIAVSEDSIPDP